MKRIYLVLACLMMLVPARAFAAAATTTTAGATGVSPEAKAVIDKIGDVYGKLKSLDLAGKFSGEFEVDGQKDNQSTTFTSAYSAPNRFRSETKDDAIVGSTGEKLYIYAPQRKLYSMTDAPKAKVPSSELPDPFGHILAVGQSKDPSLALALAKDPATELTKSSESVAKLDDVAIDGKPYTALKFTQDKGPTATLLIDPATSLVRRVIVDVSAVLLKQGASDVKKAQLTIDYTTSNADAPTKPESFAWAPPAGAKDAEEAAAAGDDDNEASKALLGKAAPEFKLKDLDGKDVALSELKGSVVVLDFWATWCGPCVASLPNLDKIYQDKKGDGLKVFAVNQSEDKELVQGFIKSKNLTLPVLLDSDGKVGNSYKAEAIPETVVVGKDGTVRKVFVGAGPGTEKQLREAIDAAMKASK